MLSNITINALTARVVSTGQLIQAIGFEDTSDSIYFYLSTANLDKELVSTLLNDIHFELTLSEQQFFIETEVYHLVGVYGDLEIKVEQVTMS